jgi:hypothetical protein
MAETSEPSFSPAKTLQAYRLQWICMQIQRPPRIFCVEKTGGGWTKSLGPAYGLTRNHREMIAWRETDTPTRRGGRLELYLAFVASLPAFVALVSVGKRQGS